MYRGCPAYITVFSAAAAAVVSVVLSGAWRAESESTGVESTGVRVKARSRSGFFDVDSLCQSVTIDPLTVKAHCASIYLTFVQFICN